MLACPGSGSLLVPSSPGLYRFVRDQLGSVRRVYMRGNRIVRRDDLGRHDQTVLLLHGFMQTRNVWEVMEDRLRYDGYGVFSFDLGGLFNTFNTRPIPALAEAVSAKIERVCEKYGIDRFHVIGHSKGGLIARHYVQFCGGDRRVKSLIALGTPFHGTPTALVGAMITGGGLLGRSVLQMLPHSPLVRRMARDSFPAHVPLISVYSRHDLVCPHWCSVLRPPPGATGMKNVPVRGIGHTALTHDPGVYLIVRSQLEEASKLWEERTR